MEACTGATGPPSKLRSGESDHNMLPNACAALLADVVEFHRNALFLQRSKFNRTSTGRSLSAISDLPNYQLRALSNSDRARKPAKITRLRESATPGNSA